MSMWPYESLKVGDRLFRLPEVVVEIETLQEDAPNDYAGGTHKRDTGFVRLVTRFLGVTSEETVKATDLVHSHWCDAE